MAKAELVGKIASEGVISKLQADKAVDGFVAAVSDALSDGDRITLAGFRTFSVVARSQRKGRNPRIGEKIKNRASKVVKFKEPVRSTCPLKGVKIIHEDTYS